MPYCYSCGKEVTKEQNYCSSCGYKFNHIPKCFEIFGYVGFGLGIGSFIMAFIPLYGMFFNIFLSTAAIVLSSLGKKEPKVDNKTSKGLVFGILGLSISIIMFIGFLILLTTV